MPPHNLNNVQYKIQNKVVTSLLHFAFSEHVKGTPQDFVHSLARVVTSFWDHNFYYPYI